ncbi:hypothetical protein K457DRAFT_1825616 [Linnemannia elongata AG-77]|uniref:Uncharacterized protein n=1 Tax=Linnemannia elongata AG-77 TaxID=1314771 RepID=A0A197JAZ7_9FUNG|nr:hypothetical protein K457DRAFT_1825616 [Linnemannia elongata AG-77]
MTLYGSVYDHLKDLQASCTVVDLEANKAYARKMALLLFLSRLLVFKHCLSVPGSSETFTSARWTLLQVCPHVLFHDIFNALFLILLDLQHHGLSPLSLMIRKVYGDAKGRLVERGCLPKIKDGTRLLVINDEAQSLGGQLNGFFQSKSSSEDSSRPLLSPILHAFRDIGQQQLTLVTCGTEHQYSFLSSKLLVRAEGVFGVSGCGKTRAVIELLSQHWGFYFNASNDDWGSSDMMTLHSTVRDYLNDAIESSTADREANNAYARKTTLLLFLSRLLVFKYCLNVPGSSETFTSARWTLLQVCPHVLFDQDIFNILFLQLLNLRHHPTGHLLALIRHSSGSDLKDSSKTFEYLEFPGWTDMDSIKTYISRVRMCLQGDKSKQDLNEHLPQSAIDLLFEKFEGRFRPAIVAVERIIERNDPAAWKAVIEDAEDKLVSWKHRSNKGNLCGEIERLGNKHNKYKDQLRESVDSVLGLLMYQRCMFGNHDLVLKEVNPALVEHAFGRIKIIRGRAVTVMDEPFVSKAVENYFAAIDPYFAREVRKRMVKSSPIEQGCMFERFMMKVFSETFNTRPLSEWPHQPPISEMCPALVGKVEIVGWREPGLEQGTTHHMMAMEEFMDAHVNHRSTRDNMSVAPFYFPKSNPSGPDLVFFIRIGGDRVFPVFVQMKLHQGNSNFSEKDWKEALSTVSAPKIEDHAKNFRKYCPDNVYISMIVAYPTKWTDKLPAPSELPKDSSGVQQVVINVSDNNFGVIFPQEHVEFIDRLKNARKRSVEDNDSNDEDCSKKQRS